MVHFETDVGKIPGAASGGAPRVLPRLGEGVFFKISLKIYHIWTMFKMAIWRVFQNFTI